MLNRFLKTEIGQRCLLLLAPFFLSPREVKGSSHEGLSLFKSLYVRPFAPAIGAVFLVGALATFLRFFHLKVAPLQWLVNYKEASFIFGVAAILSWIGYCAALSRYSAGVITDRLHPGSHLKWPIEFWLTYYGGNLLVIGVVLWLFAGFLWMSFSPTTNLICLGVLILFSFYLRLELRLVRQERNRHIHYLNWATFNTVSLIVFASLQGLAVVTFLFFWP